MIYKIILVFLAILFGYVYRETGDLEHLILAVICLTGLLVTLAIENMLVRLNK